jgi:hypothetical protein
MSRFPDKCPLRGATTSTSGDSLEGLRQTHFSLAEQGGSGIRYFLCTVCGKEFGVQEDMGYHVPQIQWPEQCLNPHP